MTDLLHSGDALSALIDGELTESEADVVRTHVVACVDCSAELAAVREARVAMRSLPGIEPPAGFIESLLAGGLAVEGEDRPEPGRVVRLPARRGAVANVAAAVAAGMLLVVSFGGSQAQAVAPQVSGQVERHASTVSAISAGLGGPNPILGRGEVTPTTMPRRSLQSVSGPYVAPPSLAGYRLVDAFGAPHGVHLLYEKGEYALSVFEEKGNLDFARLPQHGTRIEVDGHRAWRWEGGTADGRVLVVERGEVVVTLVGDESGAAVMAAAEALPGSPGASIGSRLGQACSEALDMLSPVG